MSSKDKSKAKFRSSDKDSTKPPGYDQAISQAHYPQRFEGGYIGPYPGRQESYPGPHASYPGPQPTYPGPQPTYPGPHGSYPGPQGSYPEPQESFPRVPSQYQARQNGQPGHDSSFHELHNSNMTTQTTERFHERVIISQPVAPKPEPAIKPESVPKRKPVTEWSSDICDCCDNKTMCCRAMFWYPCFECEVAASMDEPRCLPCNVPGYQVALRTKLRTKENIKGNIRQDCCIACCCPFCSLLQLAREIKFRKHLAEQLEKQQN
ncbi:uncharacterized protein LOC131931828 [Physella acuta]|uniref:uncharacterized protein LOC131931828 n=1 Tax=Physella acuta TaxID=109671 RepID=UPI0027DCBC2A|nr:uncharacterized protein LOC131931828 [Physella acuta]